jgi:hypothetical protein
MTMARSTPTPKRAGRSIQEFCNSWGVSRATFDNWRRRGLAPKLVQPIPRGRVLITQEAESEWVARHASLATAITTAAE